MQHDAHVFTANNPVAYGKSKRNQMLGVAGFAVSVILVILALIDGNNLKIFIFSVLLVSNGISLLFFINRKPVTLEMDRSSIKLNNEEIDKTLGWKDIKMARYEERYLDLFWGSSFRKSIDLQMFPEDDRLKIKLLAEKYLAQHNVFIVENQHAGLAIC